MKTQPEEGMRTGAALVRASNVYAQEDVARTWRLFLSTVAVHLTVFVGTLAVPWWPVKLVGTALLSLLVIRLFIFYHDYLHGAIFRKSTLGRYVMYVVGLYTLSAPSVWKETHDYHHRNNAKLIGSSIGSYPLVTVGIWRMMKPKQKKQYAMIRHPLSIMLGWVTTFVLGMCIAPFQRDAKQHWQGPVTLVLYLGIFVASFFVLGWVNALAAIVLPALLASALGSYLFYAQHNFPDAKMMGRREWNYHDAALNCSSMFDMNPVMHWFTGNIGYHHVHHLNHKIPFYRLPEAMAGMPELQNPGRTSWHPRDIWACLRLDLWDADSERMVSFAEAEQILAAKAAAAAK